MTHNPVVIEPVEIAVPGAAIPKGPYSPAVAFNRLLFVSGQGARVPLTDQLAGPDIETQTEQCLKNVETILAAAGSGFAHVLKCSVFLTDMAHFDAMNGVYERVFAPSRPARTTVAVSQLPTKGLLVEIDCIAYLP
jgi:2-iminobutanoate/2-iminopropanoate deaminase